MRPRHSKRAREKARRDRLFRQHPYCHWCGVKLVMPKCGPRMKFPLPDNAATIDHRHGKLDPNRREDFAPENWTVLACHKCNNERGRLDELAAGIDELQRRAGNHPEQRAASLKERRAG